ncbi:MAG: undecaprenyl-diphosphate phosphatase [Eubacteriales bacterium]|nr:undecaprenyl-diphosphate phosphatase [Eubacteriales bacterium]
MQTILELLKAVLLGVVQGITEWLPISSTGHMILINEFVKMDFSKDFVDMFMVVVQLGSILAVVVLYFNKLNPWAPRKTPQQRKNTWSLWLKVLVACVPAGVIGILFDDQIDTLFYNAPTIAIALIVYGVAFLIIESRKRRPRIRRMDELDYKTAFFIGLIQVLALIPGTSRSGSTILGAVLLGCSRYVAAEFSFFLAVPVMFGASAVKLLGAGFAFSGLEWAVLLVGMAVAFGVSVLAIRFLMQYIKKHNFKAFGLYRIVLGAVVLLYFLLLK